MPPTAPEDFHDEMMIIAHCSGPAINKFLNAFRQAGIAPVKLKAVLTATNSAWTPLALHGELKQEAEYFRQMRAFTHERMQREGAAPSDEQA